MRGFWERAFLQDGKPGELSIVRQAIAWVTKPISVSHVNWWVV
jgi:hypothetical protein